MEHKPEQIIDALAKKTDDGKLQWKPDANNSRWLFAHLGDWQYRIWLKQDGKNFSLKVYEKEKLVHQTQWSEPTADMIKLWKDASSMEPMASILKGLEA